MKTYIADRKRQLIYELAEYGYQSEVYKNETEMNELLAFEEARKHPVAAYYLYIYAKNKGEKLSDYVEIGDTIVVPHDISGGVELIAVDKDIDFEGCVTWIAKNVLELREFHASGYYNVGGDSRYIFSNINQYLNATEREGNWFKSYENPNNKPSYELEAGFLYHFDSEFIVMLQSVSKMIPVYDSTGSSECSEYTYDETSAKVFLPSVFELGRKSDQFSHTYAYFKEVTHPYAYPSKFCKTQINTVESYPNANQDDFANKYSNGEPYPYWTSTPATEANVYNTSYMDGGIISQAPSLYYTIGIRPLFVL